MEEAGAALMEALRLGPAYADAHSNIGLVFHQQGHFALARACFEAALRLQPDHSDALFNLGNVLLELARPEEAVSLYRRAHHPPPHPLDLINQPRDAPPACHPAGPARHLS